MVEAIGRIPDFPPSELAQHPSRDPAQYSTLHLNLGKSYALQRSCIRAEQHYEEGVQVLKDAGVSERAYFFEADAGLAYVYWKTGRLAQAKSRYESALEYVRTLAPSTHPVVRPWEREHRAVVKALGR